MLTITSPEGDGAKDALWSRRAVSALFFTGYAAAALSATAEPIHTDSAGLTIETVALPATDIQLPAFLARPDAPGRFPAVIVASEIFGVHEYIKDVCRRLARLGYVAIAPAFFVRVADPAPLSDIRAVIKIVAQASDQQVMGDVGAAIAYLQRQSFVSPAKLAITGFCWGGGTTWLACEEFPQLKAGVAWYGRMAPPSPSDEGGRLWPLERVEQLHAPVLGLYGAKDPLAQSIPAMRAALAAAHKDESVIIVYPDAGHGFHADYRDSYNAADAKDGWSRMLAFFADHGVAPHLFKRRD
jgi:carboxymethylenebutenolidase